MFEVCQGKLLESIPATLFLTHEEAKWLSRWIPNPGVPSSKPLGGSKVDSAFHPAEVDKMSTRSFWELNGKK